MTQLVQLDSGKNEVWGVNRWNEIFRRTGLSDTNHSGDGWEQHQGEMTYVSTAEEGIVWAIDDDHDVWVLKAGTISVVDVVDNEPTWTPIPNAQLVYVDVGRQGQLVGLRESGCSFWRKGITEAQPQGVDEWWDLSNDKTNMETYYQFNTIAMCQTGNMFATLKTGDSKLYFRAGVAKDQRWGTEWVPSQVDMGENIAQVSCGYRGYVWAVSASGKVFRLDGITADRPQGESWTEMQNTGMEHISVGDNGAVWANTQDGSVMLVGDNENQSWTEVDGSLVQLDVGSDRVVGVNNWGEIFEREGLDKTAIGSKWTQINGHLKQVTTS